MRKILIAAICTACVLFSAFTATAQKTKNAMTNADVVEMVGAGLPENTIVLAIQQSEPNFDTSPKALIELKKQGASQKVLEAMLQPKAAKSAAPSKTETVPPFAQQQPQQLLGGSEAMSPMEVTLIDGEKRVSMKHSQSNIRGSSAGMIMNPFGKAKVKSALDGNHAQLRVGDTTPEFEISLPANVNAANYLVLIKFNPKSDRREIEVGRAGIAGSSMGFRKEAIVPTTFEEVKTQAIGGDGGPKYTLYRVKVVNALPPGEYAFAPQSMYYDFGIDSGR